MIALSGSFRYSTLGTRLIELMHLRDLVKQGADSRHVNAVAGWREAPFFDARERAACAWADAINALPQRDDTDAAYPAVREQPGSGNAGATILIGAARRPFPLE